MKNILLGELSMKKRKMNYYRAASAVAMMTATIAAPVAAAGVQTYSDVSPEKYYYEAVMELSARGVIQGYPDGTFKPEQGITRGQAAKVLANILMLDTKNVVDPNFQDIATTHPYYGAIAALKQAGILDGFEDGTFREGMMIQRNHLAKIIATALNLVAQNAEALPFTDVSEAYKGAIAALYELGITTGKTATVFDGAANLTRSQFVVMVKRVEKLLLSQSAVNETVTFKVSEYSGDSIAINGKQYAIDPSLKALFTKENQQALANATLTVSIKNGVVTNVSHLALNHAGTEEAPFVLDAKQLEVGALTINADHIVVKNLQVAGDAVITTAAMSSVAFDQVKIAKNLIVDKQLTGAVASTNNLFAQGDSDLNLQMNGTNVGGDVVIDRNGVSMDADQPIAQVVISASVAYFGFNGTLTVLTVDSTIDLELVGDANIEQVIINTAIEVALMVTGIVNALEINNPATHLFLGFGAQITSLNLPEGSNAAQVVSNYADVLSQVMNTIIGGNAMLPPPVIPPVSNPDDIGNQDGGSIVPPPVLPPILPPIPPQDPFITAEAAVFKAEQSSLHENYKAASNLVWNLPESPLKAVLQKRMDFVERAVNIVNQIEGVRTSIEAAESAITQEAYNTAKSDYDSFVESVDDLKQEGANPIVVVQFTATLADFAKRLATIEASIPNEFALAEAAVLQAEQNSTQENYAAASSLVSELPNGLEKDALQKRVEFAERAVNIVNQIEYVGASIEAAESEVTQETYDTAKLNYDSFVQSVDDLKQEGANPIVVGQFTAILADFAKRLNAVNSQLKQA